MHITSFQNHEVVLQQSFCIDFATGNILTESQLAQNYSTMDALRTHPEIAKFIEWVSNKPTHIHAAIKRCRDKGFL
jgi:hypothetical protein